MLRLSTLALAAALTLPAAANAAPPTADAAPALLAKGGNNGNGNGNGGHGNNGNGHGPRANPGNGNGHGPSSEPGNGNGPRANPGNGNGNGPRADNGPDGAGDANGRPARVEGRLLGTTPVFCPPGLANRDPACVPPGQVRGDDGDRAVWQGWSEGDTAPEGEVVWLEPEDDPDLPALPDGQRYAVINGTLVALDAESFEILDLIRATQAVTTVEDQIAAAEAEGRPLILTGASPFFCPPGLADRDPACVPPGQAAQGVTTEEWLGYGAGDVAPEEALLWIEDPDVFDLPALPDGQRYAVINGTIVALDDASYEILDLIRTAAAVSR
ncbi:hypothetical protein [Wenxinia marina]|uniref:Uncharacterized protein n=1 Tax=Wenxinia marina DSM 24838 TaxID=1123501 RepID=A0A0D0Q677_9RHOB|nr:hypothetical protein [Wenxinia marina]KIQ69974.1 hypothetical protein Wenmar_01544 [Wenxinia marina DSM 24838]GGL62607.1 hypothetical protein GCM10011392_16490 [Wenxinia marina]